MMRRILYSPSSRWKYRNSNEFKTESRKYLLHRRKFLRLSALAPFAMGMGLSLSETLLSKVINETADGIYKFTVGDLECIAISDGITHYGAHVMFTNAPDDELRNKMTKYDLDPEAMPSSYTCLAVRSGGEWTLIDTGIGPIDPNLGKLLPRLSEAGIKPEDISTVIITHAHPDHIGGNTDDQGNVNFPNAQFIMWKDDWDFWTDETQLAKLPDVFGDFTRKNLPPIKGQLELLEKETEVHTGIYAIPAQGHTPGHMIIGLSSGGEQMLVIGDAMLHQINIAKPGWYSQFDIDPERAVQTRKKILERSEAEGAPLQCFHFYPFPGLGNVEKYNDAWRWEPI